MTSITTGLVMLFIYLVSMVILVQYKKDTSIANFTWGGGVLFVALYTLLTMSSFSARQLALTTLLVIWAGRLITHLYMRYTGKDPRFASWKWQGLKALAINIAWVFGQTIVIVLMGYPIFLVNTSQASPLTTFDFLSIGIALFGFCFEAISDRQLLMFMSNTENKDRVMHFGLWCYSRHPNYFGEAVFWWGIFLLALPVSYGWTAIIAPITITFMLLCISGVPLLERAMETNPEYREYQRATPIFIPWFPKK